MADNDARDGQAGRPLNILIVDDSSVMRAMIKRVAALSAVPIGEIYEASDGQAALQVLEAHPIDAVFTDINMPIMNGTELLKEIGRQDRWKHVLRVIISTDGSIARRQEVSGLDVRHYVEKPFRPEVMRDVLSEITSGAHAH